MYAESAMLFFFAGRLIYSNTVENDIYTPTNENDKNERAKLNDTHSDNDQRTRLDKRLRSNVLRHPFPPTGDLRCHYSRGLVET